jgi:hypothetical protein
MKRNIAIILPVIFFALSCNKQVVPLLPGMPDAQINCYNASEVLMIPNIRHEPRGNGVFIDDTSSFPGSFLTYFSAIGDALQTGEQMINPGIEPTGYQLMSFHRLAAGNHSFYFTGIDSHVLADTTIAMFSGSRTLLYLSESPEADDAYRILSVPEDWTGVEGKVRIRFVNLNPDAGTLKCYQTNNSGQPLFTQLNYGEATPYILMDTAGTAQSRSHFVLRIFTGNDTAQVLISASVPAIVGASFVAVIQGFSRVVTRRIRLRTDSNGRLVDSLVSIQPKLRVNLRRTF